MSMASAAAPSAASVRVMAVPMTLGFNAATSPPALCATGPFAIACAPGRASAALVTRASGSAVLRATMDEVSFRGTGRDRPAEQGSTAFCAFRAPRGTLGSATHAGARGGALTVAAMCRQDLRALVAIAAATATCATFPAAGAGDSLIPDPTGPRLPDLDQVTPDALQIARS